VKLRPATLPVMHCATQDQAEQVLAALTDRMAEVGLQLNPTKTRIVYCQDSNRRGPAPVEHTSFTFLGYTFRARRARNRNGITFASFLPAISKHALKRISGVVRSWRLHRRTGHTLTELARAINPIVHGWMQYYGAFYRSVLHPLLQRINAYLMRWLRRKYRRLRGFHKAMTCWQDITTRCPRLFAHWQWTRGFWGPGLTRAV
jgi:RNA-directed DNA polymerase